MQHVGQALQGTRATAHVAAAGQRSITGQTLTTAGRSRPPHNNDSSINQEGQNKKVSSLMSHVTFPGNLLRIFSKHQQNLKSVAQPL
ncbi:hypothetical protein E2C01_039718 [Portunus trituberculatus]|uniref:Uncharacterized protein n=1 Tax=Portunus trituberculatus TaxID=210409 RepID=A0A5B7FFG6_PORTR|nr:hypothetical protein [Portunus trituberculatus]